MVAVDHSTKQLAAQNDEVRMEQLEQKHFNPCQAGSAGSTHQKLVSWLLDNAGYLHPYVRIVHSPEKGFHAEVAKGQTINSETRIASCPVPLTMSVLNALDVSPFSCQGSRFPQVFLLKNLESPEMLQAFFLMEQSVLGPASWWAPYIATLPTVADVRALQFETPDEAAWIRGTNLEGGISVQMMRWRDLYDRGLQELQSLKWANAHSRAYSWELFQWAATIFGSRSFTSQILTDTLPADKARPAGRKDPDHAMLSKLFAEQFAVLLPVLDLLNHKPMAKIEWQARSSFVGLQVLESYESGQELCNNYGPRDNEGLLLAYGFTITDNEFDHAVISVKAPPGSPLADARTWKRDVRSDPDFKSYLFNINHPRVITALWSEASVFSFELLDSISVLCANERELQSMYSREQTLMSACLGEDDAFDDFRNLLCTLSQLFRECEARAKKLRETDPAFLDPLRVPATQKEHYAQVYRSSQLLIHETAGAMAWFVIFRACSGLDEADIRRDLRAHLSPESSKNLASLVAKYPCLSRPKELFSVTAMLELLPPDIVEKFQRLMHTIEGDLGNSNDGGHTVQAGISLSKMRFAVLLSLLRFETDHRLKSWMQQLTEWYPPEDESWSYVPSPGPWDEGEEPPLALVALLSTDTVTSQKSLANAKGYFQPKSLCWAWNIVEEEGFAVQAKIVNSAFPEEERIDGDIGFLLYVKLDDERGDAGRLK